MMPQKITQRPSQRQKQKLSQRQINSLKILSLNRASLMEEIQRFSDENPALEVKYSQDSTLLSQNRNAASQYASDEFQKTLENSEDKRESLKSHLLAQLDSKNYSELEEHIGRLLIDNLDKNGFHIFQPSSIIEKKIFRQYGNSLVRQKISFMENEIQNFDPSGCCCKNFEESLFVQAKINSGCTPLSLFILDGHFDFLDPPIPEKILKKIKNYAERLEQMQFWPEKQKKEMEFLGENKNLDEMQIEETLSFIKSLNPYPASGFGYEESRFIVPDVYVNEDENGNLIVEIAREGIAGVSVSKEFLKNEDTRKKADEAQIFIDSLLFRDSTLTKAAEEIVRRQKSFFEKGPGHINPFLQKELSSLLQVSQSTVSRIATGKYILCKWGLFEFSYFFAKSVAQEKGGVLTGEKIKAEIRKILESGENPDKKRPLSDKKIAEILEKNGIKIARRTVAKYRSQLNLGSSYERNV